MIDQPLVQDSKEAKAGFLDPGEARSRLLEQQYVCDRRVSTVVFLAERMNKPVLVEGPAGVGKTELGKALAAALDRELIRLQCYEGLDEAKALYEWEYGKQLLYTHILQERVGLLLQEAPGLAEAAELLRAHEDIFFSEDFLVERPILRAARSEQPVVLLIDEIDRADEEFEAFLLEFLSDYQVTIPEIGTLVAKSLPVTILTSNRTRELSEALKRRCLHLQLDYPTPEVELDIMRRKAPDVTESLARELVNVVQSLRTIDLRKPPSTSETLDWVQALVVLNAPELTGELIEETISVLIKHDSDYAKALSHLGIGKQKSAASSLTHSHGSHHDKPLWGSMGSQGH